MALLFFGSISFMFVFILVVYREDPSEPLNTFYGLLFIFYLTIVTYYRSILIMI